MGDVDTHITQELYLQPVCLRRHGAVTELQYSTGAMRVMVKIHRT